MHRKFASKNWISFGEDDLFTGYRMKGKKQQKRCKFNLKREREKIVIRGQTKSSLCQIAQQA